MNKLDLIGKRSLPLCKNEDKIISKSAIEINQLAQDIYRELNKLENESRYREQEVDEDEPIVKFL